MSKSCKNEKWKFIHSSDDDFKKVINESEKEFDLIFIDSFHDPDHVKKLIFNYFNFLKKNGIMIIDDISWLPYSKNNYRDHFHTEIINRDTFAEILNVLSNNKQSMEVFFSFNDLLNLNGYIFFEVPNCPKEYWNGRPYDGLHLLYYTKKSFEKLAEIHGLDFINFSFSAHSFENDRNYQIEDLKSVQNNFSFYKLKRLIKKFLPKKIARDLKDYKKGKKTRDKAKLDWFANNTGDNCYIRGILKKSLDKI